MNTNLPKMLFLLLTLSSSYCTTQKVTCSTPVPGCGFCWRSTLTHGQVHGGRKGNLNGPQDGLPCSDWTGSVLDCDQHVDCGLLQECVDIAYTYCGWCEEDGQARREPYGCTQWITNFTNCSRPPGPAQIHIHYTNDPTSMVVKWSTQWNATDNLVILHDGRFYVGITEYFYKHNERGFHYLHNATLTGLVPGQNYSYKVVSDGHSSMAFQFQARRNDTDYTLRFVYYGDLGRTGGGYILGDLMRENVSFFIHAGDFAYDLHDDSGLRGDIFGNVIQPFAARIPLQTCIGNHENYYMQIHYRRRFREHLWYSWEQQHVKFISLSSEVYYYDFNNILAQEAWLKKELANIEHAWTIVFLHRPMYCSNANSDDCTQGPDHYFPLKARLEPIMRNVNLILEAHEHSLEILYPVFNNTVSQRNWHKPVYPVHIISGFGGCNEQNGVCVNPMSNKSWPWSAYRSGMPGQYSYLRFHVYNKTHIRVENWVTERGMVDYEFWVIK